MKVEDERQSNLSFLRGHLETLQKHYEYAQELLPHELTSSEERVARWNEEQERVARLADQLGFDGSLFRDHLTRVFEERLSLPSPEQIRRKIEAVPRLIAKLEEPVPEETSTTIPEEAKLLTARQVGKVLQCGESTVRERDRKGLLPQPIRVGGSLQWRRDELKAWIEADCPPREVWNRDRNTWMEEKSNAPT